MQKFKNLLPQETMQQFSLVDKGKKSVVRTLLQAALDAADSVAKSLALAVVMCRSLWLQSSRLQQDLSFEGASLFSEHTDVKVHGLKDSRATLKSLGLYTPAPFKEALQTSKAIWYSALAGCQDLQRERSRGFRHRPPPTFTSISMPAPPVIQGVLSRHFDGMLEDFLPVPVMPDSFTFICKSPFPLSQCVVPYHPGPLGVEHCETVMHLPVYFYPSFPPSAPSLQGPPHEELVVWEVQALLRVAEIP